MAPANEDTTRMGVAPATCHPVAASARSCAHPLLGRRSLAMAGCGLGRAFESIMARRGVERRQRDMQTQRRHRLPVLSCQCSLAGSLLTPGRPGCVLEGHGRFHTRPHPGAMWLVESTRSPREQSPRQHGLLAPVRPACCVMPMGDHRRWCASDCDEAGPERCWTQHWRWNEVERVTCYVLRTTSQWRGPWAT